METIVGAHRIFAWGAIVHSLELAPSHGRIVPFEAFHEDVDLNLRHVMHYQLPLVRRECVELGLGLSVRTIDNMLQELEKGYYSVNAVLGDARDLHGRIMHELEARLFLQVPVERASYYSDWRRGWDEVLDKFPGIQLDVQEASKCFALGRYTASVYHLMRAVEPGLYSMARSLGMTKVRENWANVINDIDSLLKAKSKSTPPARRAKQQFYSDASSQFLYFKDAWRNSVMHSRKEDFFDEEKSLTIYRSVQAFLKQPSTRLKQRTR